MMLAISLGGFGSLGLVLLSEYMDDTFDRAEDVESNLHVPVLASIPNLEMDRRK
jgi:capsular polysaccharide biosynthesis protein